MRREYPTRFQTVSHESWKKSAVGQLVPVECNRLTVSEIVSIDESRLWIHGDDGIQKVGQRTLNCSRNSKCYERLFRDDVVKQNPEAEGIRQSRNSDIV